MRLLIPLSPNPPALSRAHPMLHVALAQSYSTAHGDSRVPMSPEEEEEEEEGPAPSPNLPLLGACIVPGAPCSCHLPALGVI